MKKALLLFGLVAMAWTVLPTGDALARCGKRCRASKKNKEQATKFCQDYVKKNPGAACKVDKRVCPRGYYAARKFKGKGTNYSSCVKGAKVGNRRKAKSDQNREQAQKFCKDWSARHKKRCIVDARACPTGYYAVKKFRGFGKNYSACVPGKKTKRVKEVTKKIRDKTSALRPVVIGVKTWFESVKKAAGPFRRLSPQVIKILQPHYKVDLRKVRWAMSKKVPAHGLSYCYDIMFHPSRRPNIARQLRTNKWVNESDWIVLAHELKHADQCYQWGGKNNYVRKAAMAYIGTGVKKPFRRNPKSYEVPKEAKFEKEAYAYDDVVSARTWHKAQRI